MELGTQTREVVEPPGAPECSLAHDNIVALLEAYSEALRLETKLPPLVVRQVGSRRALRWFPALRSRLFLRPLMVHHVTRAAAALERECHREALLPEQHALWSEDIALIERFQQGLPRVATRLMVGLFGAAVFLATLLVVRFAVGAHGPLESFVARLTRAIVETNRHAAINALANKSAETILLTLWLLVSVAWFAMLIPASSYRLKLAVFSLPARTRECLRAHVTLLTEAPPPNCVLRIERSTFECFDRAPPRDWPLDLMAQSLLIFPLAGWAVLVIVNINDKPAGTLLAALFVLVGVTATWVLIHTWRVRPRLEAIISDENPRSRKVWSYAIALPTMGAFVLNALLLALALATHSFST